MMLLTRPGRAAPSLVDAMAQLDDLGLTLSFRVRVDPGGTVRVVELTINPAAPGDGAITSRALRGIRLDQLAKEAVRQQERPTTKRDDVFPGAFQVPGDPANQAWLSPAPGRRPTRELSNEAARIYTAAVEAGSRAPTLAVANELGYSRSQASRLIKAARDTGLIGPIQGEAIATKAPPAANQEDGQGQPLASGEQ